VRIAFLATSSLEDPGPRGRWFPIARELVRHGHEVHLVLLHPTFDDPRVTRYFVCDGVHIAYVAQMHVYGKLGQRRYFSLPVLSGVALRAALALATYARQLRPDVLHVAKPQPMNGLAALLARRKHTKLFVDCDDYEAESNRFTGRWQRWGVRWWEDRLPKHADAVTVNTRFLFERCRALGVPAQRIFYVPNGISDWQFEPPAPARLAALREHLGLTDMPVVAYCGAMHRVAHSLDLLLEAFALLHRKIPQARLLMIGDGDDLSELRDRAHRLGISAAVHWVGYVSPKEVPCYLALADCTVDPVHDTPGARARSPLKILESLAQGVPVATGDVGDRREMLGNGQAGVLVRPGDAVALAEGMLSVLIDSSWRAHLSTGALECAQAYRWGRLIEESWLRIYR
jgi:glycosyltransferase involved in cell wall biosynthesis